MGVCMKKRLYGTLTCFGVILLSVICIIIVNGCKSTGKETDILTQVASSKDREDITILVKYAFTINGFEKAVEKKFPNINIIQVGNYTHDMGIDEYETRLEHDDIPDIVMTWPLEVGEEYWSDRLMDLSGMEFTNRYNLSMLNDISRDGKLYYLPGPAQVRGILYNKTLFEEKGWQVPKDFTGFVELCKTIEASGMRSLQLGLGNEEVLDTAFVGYSYEECYSKPMDTQWIEEYNNGEHSFGEHFSPALDTFQYMIDQGVLKKEDLDISYAEREKMFFTRECAMVEDSVLMTRMGGTQTGSTDEYALMPFFNPNGGEDWARLYMVCFIGLNKELAEPENKEKYELVMELMNYLSNPEGQEALMSDTGAMYSSLIEVGPPDVPEIEELIPALKEGRYALFPTFENAQSALREGLTGMVRGEYTKEDVITMVDERNASPIKDKESSVLGKATEDFTLIETGNFFTDAMREEAGTDIALFLDNGKDGRYNGKGISAKLYKGDVTENDIGRIFPDLKHGEEGTLWKVTVTGEDLRKILEYTMKVDNNEGGWFYYFSGLRMEYSPSSEPGERIKSITMADKSDLEDEKLYTVAVMDETVSEQYVESCEQTQIKILDIIKESVKSLGTISPTKDERFKIVGGK